MRDLVGAIDRQCGIAPPSVTGPSLREPPSCTALPQGHGQGSVTATITCEDRATSNYELAAAIIKAAPLLYPGD